MSDPLTETVQVTITYQIKYDPHKPGARAHAIQNIRVFQDTIGNSHEFGVYEVTSVANTMLVVSPRKGEET